MELTQRKEKNRYFIKYIVKKTLNDIKGNISDYPQTKWKSYNTRYAGQLISYAEAHSAYKEKFRKIHSKANDKEANEWPSMEWGLAKRQVRKNESSN